MKISELIQVLEEYKEELGDAIVYHYVEDADGYFFADVLHRYSLDPIRESDGNKLLITVD